jgi:2-iminobutanoate/2-iminopropanoate deaminase
VLASGLWFVSGQLPLDHASGTLVEGDATAQAHAAIDNVQGILEEAGLGLGDVAMLTVLLADIGDWGALDAVVAKRFPPDRLPARIVYQAGALPLGALVEVQAIAAQPA